jgi:tetratricopeptide (TPR) repeat protein
MPLYERALEINEKAGSEASQYGHEPQQPHEKALGPEHTETTSVLLHDQGDLAGARPLYERALAIREKAFGPERPRTATTLNNLAALLYDQGDLAAARPLY